MSTPSTNSTLASTLASPTGGAAAAAEIISLLNLEPYSEKGYLHETFRDPISTGTGSSHRSASTAIYYLLEGRAGYSLWHKVVDAAEVWHYYAGAPLTLELVFEEEEEESGRGKKEEEIRLGVDLRAGQRPQGVVPRGVWQRARCLGEWTLVGTTVAPGFEPSGFILMPEGWQPGDPEPAKAE